MQDDHYNGVLLEDIRDKLAAFAEVMSDVPKDVARLKDDVSEIKTDIKAIKAVMKDHSHHIDDHEARITQLETA